MTGLARPAPSAPQAAGRAGPRLRRAAQWVALAAICAAAMATSLAADPGWGGVAAVGLVPILLAIAVIDARCFIIPDELNGAGIVLGLAAAVVSASSVTEGLLTAGLRGAMLALVFLAVRMGYRALRGREGLGLGDVKLAALAGVWLEVEMMPVAIEIAAVAGLIAYGLRQLSCGRVIRPRSRLPFGLFLAPAIWIGWILDRWLPGTF